MLIRVICVDCSKGPPKDLEYSKEAVFMDELPSEGYAMHFTCNVCQQNVLIDCYEDDLVDWD